MMERSVIQKILQHLKLAADPPPIAPARQVAFAWAFGARPMFPGAAVRPLARFFPTRLPSFPSVCKPLSFRRRRSRCAAAGYIWVALVHLRILLKDQPIEIKLFSMMEGRLESPSALRQRLIPGGRHATRQPPSPAHPTAARVKTTRHIAAVGVSQGVPGGCAPAGPALKWRLNFLSSWRQRLPPTNPGIQAAPCSTT